MIRSRPLLTYLLVCLTPLLLLAALNYWNGLRAVDEAVGADLRNRINAFSDSVDNALNQQENDFLKAAMSPAIRQFVAARAVAANGPATSRANDVDAKLPADLHDSMADLLDRRGFLASVAIFDRNRRPLLLVERDAKTEGRSVTAHFYNFPPDQPKADEHVWDTQGNVLLAGPVAVAPFGVSLLYTAPVFGESRGQAEGALVGVLNLDPIFSTMARAFKSNTNRENNLDSMTVVLDHSGTILYHPDKAFKGQPASSIMPAFMPIAAAMMADNSGTQSFRLPAGQNYLATYAPLPRLNVSVAVACDRSQLLSSAHRAGIVGLLLALVLGIGGALLLVRDIQKKSHGIESVTEGLTAIAKGELDRRIELLSNDDARGLADNINVVTERLRAQIAREAESRQFDSFVRFSAMLTHDLKNAIEGLSLTVGNMERHFDNEQFRADAMKSLTAATDKLKAIVTRLSKPVTTLSGEHKRAVPTDLIPILRRVVALTAEPLHQKHNIQMSLPPRLMALTDAERIEKVFENLVLNAVEAMSERSGSLIVAAEQGSGENVVISISDTGPGMSRHFIEERLFRPFATTKKSGVGLGLYTCREVLKASAGSIEVESVEGTGTTFRVMLPSAPTDKR